VETTQASEFLAALTDQAPKDSKETIIQTFDDSPAKRRALTLVRGALGASIALVNQAGAGVFVQLNAGKERGAKCITGLRACVLDLG